MVGRVSIVARMRRPVSRSQLRPVDVGLALGTAVVQVGGATLAGGHGQHHSLSVFGALLLATGPLALLARRRAPRTVLAIALVATAAYGLLDEPQGPIFFALIVALVTTVMAGRRAFAWGVLTVGYGLIMWLPSFVTDEKAPGLPAAMAIVAWLLVLGTGAEIARVRRERAIERAQVAEQEARRRAGEQRLRIARDLHDVLAHHISLINVQAGVALHLLDERPEQVRPALTAIKQASKETLAELRSVLDILRDTDDDAAPLTPAPGLEQLDELLAGARASGLTVECRVEGERGALPARVDLAAFRIVQEALTNVRRHAGPARATVSLRYGADELAIQIDDDGARMNGRHEDIGAGGGNGIPGMRERANALGGTLETGPRAAAGGFRVLARLPLEGEQS
jgi:signal transduction histidine kinase